MATKTVCLTCGKTFNPRPSSRSKTGLSVYCSRECYHNSTRVKWDCDKETLRGLYINEQLSTAQIAEKLGLVGKINCKSPLTARESVRKALVDFGIPLRSHTEAAITRNANYPYEHYAPRGELNVHWRGGIHKNFGYAFVKCPDHPRADFHGYVREHILVWEKAHNKALPVGYVVHHLNGIRDDNRPENLIALPSQKHRHVLAAKGHRIASLEQRVIQLEAEVVLLRAALESGQFSLKLGGTP